MADAPAPKPKGGNLVTILSIGAVFFILLNPALNAALGGYAGIVLNPILGFGGKYPVLTILLAGALLVVATTVLRHFTTDWIATARTQAMMRHFQKEMMEARKSNNTYKLKKLQDAQPKMMDASQEMQKKQLKMMPLTMIVVIPIFAWVSTFLATLDYTWFSAPWNPAVDMFATNGILPFGGPEGTSVFPHWILLYMALSIPLGSLINKSLKFFAWKERWEKRHPHP